MKINDTTKKWATILLSLFAGLALWEAVGWQFNEGMMAPFIGNDNAIASFLGIEGNKHPGAGPKLIAYFSDLEFLESLKSSLLLFSTGFLIAVFLAIPLGIILARLVMLRVALETYILMLYVTPMVALIPFILSIWGFDFWPKVLVVTLFGLFPILYNTLEGARSVKPELLEVARSFRSSEIAIWRDVLIPFTLPYALTGIRQAIGRALVGMVAAEFFLSSSGLGDEIISASRSPDMAGVLAIIALITLMGVTLMRLAQMLERRYASWRGGAN